MGLPGTDQGTGTAEVSYIPVIAVRSYLLLYVVCRGLAWLWEEIRDG